MRTDKELTTLALQMFANWLETRDVLLSLDDTIRHNSAPRRRPTYAELKEADRLRELAYAVENRTTPQPRLFGRDDVTDEHVNHLFDRLGGGGGSPLEGADPKEVIYIAWNIKPQNG